MHGWLVKLLFWSWFFGGTQRLIQYLAGLPPQKSLFLLLLAFTAWLSVRIGPIGRRINSGDWPKFLRVAVGCFTGFLLVGIIGWASISTATYSNGNKMPVAVQSQTERLLYERGILEMNSDHFLADPQTSFWPSLWLADYISVDSLKILQFLFPPRGPLVRYDYVSPGDLMIAASVILSWWTTLVIIIWSVCYATRRILKI